MWKDASVWVSVAAQLPEYGKEVIVLDDYSGHHIAELVRTDKNGHHWKSKAGNTIVNVNITHWREKTYPENYISNEK